MQVLVTGGTGYIASHTALSLLEAGHGVVLYDNLSNSRADVADRVEEISGKRAPFVEGDIRDIDKLLDTIKAHQCDAVMHFAGLKAVGESVERPLAYFDNNVGGSIVLLEAMLESGIHTLVFSSSATVYGEPQYLPLDEAHPTNAVNPYGRTKLHIEEMLFDLCAGNPDFRAVCLRYFNPAGAHPSGLIGENPGGIPNNLMPYVAQTAAGLREAVQVFGSDYPTPDGTGVRDYIHIQDLAAGHTAALAWVEHSPGWHAINLGTGRGHSVLEAIAAFGRACGKTIPHNLAPRRAGDVASCYANADKAAQLLGWKAEFDFATMCASAWKWQQQLASHS